MVRTYAGRCAALLISGLLPVGGCSSTSGTNTTLAMPAALPAPPATSGIAVNFQPANTTMTYQAAAVAATGVSKGMSGNTSLTPLGQGATVTLTTDASGNLSGMTAPGGGLIYTFPAGAASTRPATDPSRLQFAFSLSDIMYFNDEQGVMLSQVVGGPGLTASTYGIWASTARTSPGDAGLFAFGIPTPATAVPVAGSATFTGFTIGMGGAEGGAIYSLEGSVRIVANFAAQTVTSTLTSLIADSATAPLREMFLPNLSGTAAITGNAYSGPISGGALTGTLSGNFYGPMAQETAGVWRASGGGNAWIGSFGAK